MINPIEIKKIKNPTLIETNIVIFDESGYSSGAGLTKRNIPFGRFEEMCDYDNCFNKKCKIPGYKINERNFDSIKDLFSPDYNQFKFPYLETDNVYVGLESCNKNSTSEELENKLPNLTFLPNLEAKLSREKVIVMGSTMGHFHPSNLAVQEIYEFEGYGAMVIDTRTKEEGKVNSKGNIDLIMLKPGEKVIVPGNCNMTMYNLQEDPLEMQDFANPTNNIGIKNLQKKFGPVFCVYYYPKKGNLNFKLNPLYTQSDWISPSELNVKLKVPSVSQIGELVSDASKNNSKFIEKFKSLGINLITADQLPQINGIDYTKSLDENVKTNRQQLFGLIK
ncbi:MAG TPA: hypothetical protein P5277_04590 [Candidatus Paceibacterota bacterium]|nr:hypothetical protein [Candidatus Paceibacterota bacterium]